MTLYVHVCRQLCMTLYVHVCRQLCMTLYVHVCRQLCMMLYVHVCRQLCMTLYVHVLYTTQAIMTAASDAKGEWYLPLRKDEVCVCSCVSLLKRKNTHSLTSCSSVQIHSKELRPSLYLFFLCLVIKQFWLRQFPARRG